MGSQFTIKKDGLYVIFYTGEKWEVTHLMHLTDIMGGWSMGAYHSYYSEETSDEEPYDVSWLQIL